MSIAILNQTYRSIGVTALSASVLLLCACGGGGGGSSTGSNQISSSAIQPSNNPAPLTPPSPAPSPTPPPTGNAELVSLNWEMPLNRQDASALAPNEIDYYVVKFGTSLDTHFQTLITSNLEYQFDISALPQGSVRFAVSACDTHNRCSVFSQITGVTP